MRVFFTKTTSKTEFSRQILVKTPYITFHEIPSTGSHVRPHVLQHGRTDITKQTALFFNFAEAPKK